MTVADDALTVAASLTAAAVGASTGDAAAARSMSATLTAEAATYNTATTALSAAVAAETTSRTELSRSLRAAESVTTTDGGPLNFDAPGTVMARVNALLTVANAVVSSPLSVASQAWHATRSAQGAATRQRDASAMTLTTLIADGELLLDYLQA